MMDDENLIRAYDPRGWEQAARHKARYERDVAKYERLGRFRRWLMVLNTDYDPVKMKAAAHASIGDHYVYLNSDEYKRYMAYLYRQLHGSRRS